MATTAPRSTATKVLRLRGGGADRTGSLGSEVLAGTGLAPTLLSDSFDSLNREPIGHVPMPPGFSVKGDHGEVVSRQAAKNGTITAPGHVESLVKTLPEPAYVPLPKDPASNQAARSVAQQLHAANLLVSSGVDKMVLNTVCETIKKLEEDAVKVPLRGGAASPKEAALGNAAKDVWRLEEAAGVAVKVEGVDISLNDLITVRPRDSKAADNGNRQKLRSSAAPFMSALQPPMLQAGSLGSPTHGGYLGMGAFPDPFSWPDWKGNWQRKDNMRAHLEYLQCTDHRRVLIVHKIHRLGWESAKKLQEHFEWYGPVERVLVAHDKVRVSRWKETTLWQPAEIGFVVMRHFWDAARILTGGHWQKVAENAIEVMPFRLDSLDVSINPEECL